MSRDTILLTGAAGRVGRLVRPFLRGKYELILSDLYASDAVSGETEALGDLADFNLCKSLVERVSGVIHLAGLVGPEVTFEDTLNPNYRAVLNLLEACRVKGVRRFVYASSHHAIGMLSSGEVYDHLAPVSPDGYYGLSKAFGEAACSMFSHRFGIRCLIIRIGNADPEIVDGRRERLWTSDRDLAELIDIGLKNPKVGCDVTYGVSLCPDALFQNRVAETLGYQPRSRADENHSSTFVPRDQMNPEHTRVVGGAFAAVRLPSVI